MNNHHSIVIVGAGLSGLYLAWRLQQQKKDLILLEACERIGGRILSPAISRQPDSCIDLGPAWVWPEFQPRLQRLLDELGLDTFAQYTRGDLLYEQGSQNIQQHAGPSAHTRSYRIAGGAAKLTDTLHQQLHDSTVYLNTPVTSINQTSMHVHSIYKNKIQHFSADRIILALPPRVALQSVNFEPPLSNNMLQLWEDTPTWMAGHCKIVFIYPQAFWREQKLSGEVFSHQGPLTEIYDGSPRDNAPGNEGYFALTAFVGLNAAQRKQLSREQLIESCMLQLQRLFGDSSQKVIDVQIKDWSNEPYTCSEADLNANHRHPQYPDNMPRTLSNENIILAGTEVARENGGYLEGALESADEALALLS